jgi:hypothetical protein
MLRRGQSTTRLSEEERQILLDALALSIAEQTHPYTICIPLRIPATHCTPASEKRFVTRFLRRWQAHWLDSQPQEESAGPELVQEERDEDAGGVFFELTFSVGRKVSAQEKQWLEEQPGVVTVFYVREDEEDFPPHPTPAGATR